MMTMLFTLFMLMLMTLVTFPLQAGQSFHLFSYISKQPPARLAQNVEQLISGPKF